MHWNLGDLAVSSRAKPRWSSGDPDQAGGLLALLSGSGPPERTNPEIEVSEAEGNRGGEGDIVAEMDREKSEGLIVPMKPGNRPNGTWRREGGPETQNRRRERWSAYQGHKPSQRNKRG